MDDVVENILDDFVGRFIGVANADRHIADMSTQEKFSGGYSSLIRCPEDREEDMNPMEKFMRKVIRDREKRALRAFRKDRKYIRSEPEESEEQDRPSRSNRVANSELENGADDENADDEDNVAAPVPAPVRAPAQRNDFDEEAFRNYLIPRELIDDDGSSEHSTDLSDDEGASEGVRVMITYKGRPAVFPEREENNEHQDAPEDIANQNAQDLEEPNQDPPSSRKRAHESNDDDSDDGNEQGVNVKIEPLFDERKKEKKNDKEEGMDLSKVRIFTHNKVQAAVPPPAEQSSMLHLHAAGAPSECNGNPCTIPSARVIHYGEYMLSNEDDINDYRLPPNAVMRELSDGDESEHEPPREPSPVASSPEPPKTKKPRPPGYVKPYWINTSDDEYEAPPRRPAPAGDADETSSEPSTPTKPEASSSANNNSPGNSIAQNLPNPVMGSPETLEIERRRIARLAQPSILVRRRIIPENDDTSDDDEAPAPRPSASRPSRRRRNRTQQSHPSLNSPPVIELSSDSEQEEVQEPTAPSPAPAPVASPQVERQREDIREVLHFFRQPVIQPHPEDNFVDENDENAVPQ